MALKAQSVEKIYQSNNGGDVRAVDGVSFEVQAGQFVALVGPSGSGKTTMLAMLAGLLKPTSGHIEIDGATLSDLSDARRTTFRREKIGFTFQSNNLVPYLTALENVELMLRLNKRLTKQTRREARDLLARLGLDGQMKQLPHQLSGGQRQRVAIARSLIHNPSLVLADEPTASLDTERANQVVQTFADLIHEQGKAGIMVTHDLRMCRYVDTVLQMLDGKLARIITDPAEIAAFAQGRDGMPGVSAPVKPVAEPGRHLPLPVRLGPSFSTP